MYQSKQRKKYALRKTLNKAKHNSAMRKTHCTAPRYARPVLAALSVYMDMTSLEESQKVTIGHLEAARKLLPEEMFFEEAKAFDKEYLEYLEHNELELAMNSLNDLGVLCNAPSGFWRQLELAASNMGLASEEQRFKQVQNT